MHLAECKALLLLSWAVSTLVSAPSGRSFSLSLCTHPSEAAAGCLGVSVTSHRGPRHLFFPLKGHWHSCVQPSLSGLLYTLSVWLPAHPAHRVSPVRFILEDLKKKCSYFHRMYDFLNRCLVSVFQTWDVWGLNIYQTGSVWCEIFVLKEERRLLCALKFTLTECILINMYNK